MLFITGYQRTGGWLAEALAADRQANTVLEEAVGATAGVTRLRDEVFDAVLVSHEPGEVDALEVVEAIRAGGNEDAVIVLGRAAEAEASVPLFEVGTDAYLCISTTNPQALTWQVARAIERVQLLRDNRRHTENERQRLELEHTEAGRLLDQQRNLIGDLERTLGSESTSSLVGDKQGGGEHDSDNVAVPNIPKSASSVLPARLLDHYGELVRAYVVMGSGNLADEMQAFAQLLVTAGVTAHEAMLMHIDVTEQLVRGRGSRSAKHLVSRAELLILEIMVHLAEGYRGRACDAKSGGTKLVDTNPAETKQPAAPAVDERPSLEPGTPTAAGNNSLTPWLSSRTDAA